MQWILDLPLLIQHVTVSTPHMFEYCPPDPLSPCIKMLKLWRLQFTLSSHEIYIGGNSVSKAFQIRFDLLQNLYWKDSLQVGLHKYVGIKLIPERVCLLEE